jgi:hypothetical protein
MRKLFAALGALAVVAAPAAAQGTYANPNALECIRQDGGQGGFAFKTGNPSGPSDWFSVDFNNELSSCELVALCVQVSDTGNPNKNAAIGRIGIYPDNLFVDPTGATPDVGNPIAESATCLNANGAGCNTTFFFTVPLMHLGDENVHISYNHCPGDSSLFVCSDGTSPASGRSSLSTSSYSAPGPVLGVDWKIGAGVVPKVATQNGRILLNGSTATAVKQLGNVAVSFYGPEGSAGQFFLLTVLGSPLGGPLPIGFGGPLPDATSVTGFVSCSVPAVPPPGIPIGAIYLDPTDTKPNGKAKLKSAIPALLAILTSPAACGFCYGQQDDGAVGLGAWTTAIPTGTGDWFNVRHGTPSPASGVMTLTGVEIATVVSSACGNIVGNPAGGWDEVGIYPSDLAQDSSGGTPDTANPAANVAPVTIPNGTLQWGYPASFVDTADISASTSIVYHAAVKWDTMDSCMRVTADDSTSVGPDPCGVIPSSTSYSTLDGYATNAVAFSQVNWLLKIDWK